LLYRKSLKPLVFLLFTMSLLLVGCSSTSNTAEPISRTTLQFGTVIQISVFDTKDQDALDLAIGHMKTLENELSTSIAKSDVSQFNEAAANDVVVLGEHAQAVVSRGLYYSAQSNGQFDITIEPLVDLWSIGKEDAQIPDDASLTQALELVGYENLKFDPVHGTLTKTKEGVKIDLGAIAKGYAADEAARILKENGVESALINLGGNVLALGDKEGVAWKVGIQDPLQNQGAMVGIVEVTDASVITSGVYERYFEEDGVRYHHILSTDNGYPVNNEILGISILSETAIDGDALSTVVYTMGLEAGMDFIESLEGIEAIFVSRDSKIYVSTGAEKVFDHRNQAFDLISSATKDK